MLASTGFQVQEQLRRGLLRLRKKFAFEPRNEKWFTKECLSWASKLGLTWVTIDSPNLPRNVYCTAGNVYVRMHERTSWYSYRYGETELREVAKRIVDSNPKKACVFFNNDHNMLENARRMFKIIRELK